MAAPTVTTQLPTPIDRPRPLHGSEACRRTRAIRLLCVGLDPETVARLASEGTTEPPATVTIAPTVAEAAAALDEAPVDCVVVRRRDGMEALLSRADANEPPTPIVRLVDDDGRKESSSGRAFDATCESVGDLLEVVAEVVDDAGHTTRPSSNERLAELRRSNAVLSRYAAETAHDLKEPLRTVESFLELLERRHGDGLNGEAREFVEYAGDGARRMRATIEGHLSSARPGGAGESFEPVDLDAVVDDVRADLSVAIEEADATVTAGALPTVVGDRTGLRRLLSNLVANAIDHAGVPAPLVAIRADERADAWAVEVADDGVGLTAEASDRPADASVGDGPAGARGLGLAICESIVDRHGGRIWIRSTPGEGCRVRFTVKKGGGGDDTGGTDRRAGTTLRNEREIEENGRETRA